MEKSNFSEWNRLVYFVHEVYGATKKCKPGQPVEVVNSFRKTAVSLTAVINTFVPEDKPDFSRIYPIISSISVMETYLQLAKKYRFIRNTKELETLLSEVKDSLYRLLGQH